MPIEVTNTLTGRKEPFTPTKPGEVGMYVCGLTVYDLPHIGHARAYIAYDIIRRWFEHQGLRVKHIQNVTDVDDKIIARARENGEDPIGLAKRMTDEAEKDFARLNLLRPERFPKVSDHIPEIVKMTEDLIARGHAYVGRDAEGQSVYYDVRSDPDYGKLSHLNLDQMLEGVRKDVAEGKRHPADFALWKATKPGETVSWDSPWGRGRPGWHIECSAMATKYLGASFDVHGGGWDLVFPHHENELAQAESATGVEPFVRYWLHTGFLTVEGEKMSKSLGNFITLRAALDAWRPEVLRLWLAGTHYRSAVDYSEAGLAQAAKSLERIENMLANVEHALKTAPAEDSPADAEFRAAVDALAKRFTTVMDDDFNTPMALAALFEVLTEVNKRAASGGSRGSLSHARGVFLDLVGVFGLSFEAKAADAGVTDALLDLLLEARQAARKARDFATADRIRDRLAELGFVIEDTPTGPKWRRK